MLASPRLHRMRRVGHIPVVRATDTAWGDDEGVELEPVV